MNLDMDRIETVATFPHEGAVHEIDHLGVCVPDQWGMYAVYRNGDQVAEFELDIAGLRRDLRPEVVPVTEMELISFALDALEDNGEPEGR